MKSELDRIIMDIWKEKVRPLFEEDILSQATMKVNQELTKHIFESKVGKGAGEAFSVRVVLNPYDPGCEMVVDFYYRGVRVEGTGYTYKNSMKDILVDCMEQKTHRPIKIKQK